MYVYACFHVCTHVQVHMYMCVTVCRGQRLISDAFLSQMLSSCVCRHGVLLEPRVIALVGVASQLPPGVLHPCLCFSMLGVTGGSHASLAVIYVASRSLNLCGKRLSSLPSPWVCLIFLKVKEVAVILLGFVVYCIHRHI